MNTEQQAFRVAYLVAGYLKGTLSTAENVELDDWVTASMDNQRLFEDLTDPKQLNALQEWKQGLPTEQVLQRLKARLPFTEPAPISKTRSLWPALSAAAVVIIVVGLYFLLRPARPTVKPDQPEVAVVTDLPAGGNRATLTLTNGKVIPLDSLGQTIDETGVDIRSSATGELVYTSNAETMDTAHRFNTLATPKGGQYQVTLPDGTKVWLNAASSLTYPVHFPPGHRIVQLSGEAYFEVAKDPGHSFIVNTAHSNVEVFGTHFNVNAYADRPTTDVTLLEGAVTVNQRKLLPGQQATIDVSKGLAILPVDTAPVIAWTKGQFSFKDATLGEILPQLSRWYDADIEYPTPIPYHFNAVIPRSVPISKILTLLEGTGAVRFQLADHKIIVSPADPK